MSVARRHHCMIVDNYYPDIRVEREAGALVERGFDVDIICLRGEGDPRRQRLGRITVYRLPVRRRRGASAGVQLAEYSTFLAWATAMVTIRHLKRAYHSVQIHNVPDFLVFSAIVPKLTGAAVILDLHDLMPEFFASRFGGGMGSLLVRAVTVQERASAFFADRVITVTDLWREALVARGIPSSKVHVVMNLPDDRVFVRRDPAIRDGTQPLTVIYHGTITRRYGLDILLRAFQQAAAAAPLRLLLHGRGEYLPEVRQLIAELGLSDRVELSTDLLPTVVLPELIRRADIGVVPNRNDIFTDGILPTKLMEYAALGIPSIVSRSRVVTRYFTEAMVRFVEPDDVRSLAEAIIELANNADLRRSLATNAGRFADQYRWEDQAQAYTALVEQAIAESRRTKETKQNRG